MIADTSKNVSDSARVIGDVYEYPIPNGCYRCRSYRDCFGDCNPFELKIQRRDANETQKA